MKIAIIGAGNVGGTLGTRWAHAGHEVIFGSRDPDKADVKELLAKAGPTAKAAKPAEAARARFCCFRHPGRRTRRPSRAWAT